MRGDWCGGRSVTAGFRLYWPLDPAIGSPTISCRLLKVRSRSPFGGPGRTALPKVTDVLTSPPTSPLTFPGEMTALPAFPPIRIAD